MHFLSEKVRNNCISFFLCFQYLFFLTPHSNYELESNIFNIFTLQNHFLQIVLKCLYKIINNMMDFLKILQNINFKIDSKNCR
ncbi:Uncharacterized protein FWK35_00004504, partial [Aphis craccivora]